MRPGHERALKARIVLLETANVHFRAMNVLAEAWRVFLNARREEHCRDHFGVVVEAVLLIFAISMLREVFTITLIT